jgi:hypothetical protein
MPESCEGIVSMGVEGVEESWKLYHAKCSLVGIFLQFAGRVWERVGAGGLEEKKFWWIWFQFGAAIFSLVAAGHRPAIR